MPEAALIVDGVKGWICLYRYALCVVVVCMVGYDLKEHENGTHIYIYIVNYLLFESGIILPINASLSYRNNNNTS